MKTKTLGNKSLPQMRPKQRDPDKERQYDGQKDGGGAHILRPTGQRRYS